MRDAAEPFLRAIREHPHDDGPRLVYADWLDEQGDAARAEFIRVQCRLATLGPNDPEREQLAARELDLIWKFGELWRAGDNKRHFDGEFDRGFFVRGFFVPGMRVDAEAFCRFTPWIFQSAPLWGCSLTNIYGLELETGESPNLRFFVWLDASDFMDTAFLTALADNPAVANLRFLTLSFSDFNPTALLALAHSPHLSALRLLQLRAVTVQYPPYSSRFPSLLPDDVAEAITAMPGLCRFEMSAALASASARQRLTVRFGESAIFLVS